MTYSWQVVYLSTKDQTNSDGVTLSDAVVEIKWRRIGVDSEGNSAKVVGYTTLSAESTAEADFTAFADLTEEKVTGWLNTLNSASLDSYHEKIQKKLSGVTTQRAAPWA